MPPIIASILSLLGGLGGHRILSWLLTRGGAQAAKAIPKLAQLGGREVIRQGTRLTPKAALTMGGMGRGAAELAGFGVGFPAGMYATEALLGPAEDETDAYAALQRGMMQVDDPNQQAQLQAVLQEGALRNALREYIGDEADIDELMAQLSQAPVRRFV